MNIITTPAKTYLLSRHTVTIATLQEMGAPAVNALFAELKRLDVPIAGSIEFLYYNFSMDTPFVLEVAMPVGAKIAGVTNGYEYVDRPEFRNFNHTQNGGMRMVEAAYDGLFADVAAQQLPYNGEVREVYHKFSHPEAADNVTEIQIGLN